MRRTDRWRRPWCWERLKAGGEGDDRGWDGWMASPTQGTWVWVNFRSWWWTGRPGVLQSMGVTKSRTWLSDWIDWLIHTYSSSAGLDRAHLDCTKSTYRWIFFNSKYYSTHGEGNSNPLQYSCLGNPMDREAWWATVHGVAKSRTGLSDWAHTHSTTWPVVGWVSGCASTTDSN